MNTGKIRWRAPWLLAVGVVIAWVFVIIFYYYVAHKPFGVDNVTALVKGFLNFVAWLLLLAAVGLAIYLTVLVVRSNQHSRTERGASQPAEFAHAPAQSLAAISSLNTCRECVSSWR